MSSLGQHTLSPGQQALFGQRLLLLGGRAIPFHLRNIGHLGDGLFNLQTVHKDISDLQYCSTAMHCSACICSCQMMCITQSEFDAHNFHVAQALLTLYERLKTPTD